VIHVEKEGEEVVTAMAAREVMNQQIFTKTMVLQIWKPENERSVSARFDLMLKLKTLHSRAGRHFVYTSRYVIFFIRLLFLSEDKSAMEALAKRVRKKSTDFWNHTKVWQEVCTTYMKVSIMLFI
jgi:hypothetical protein